jgi:hypothetical protein
MFKKVITVVVLALAAVGAYVIGKKVSEKIQRIQAKIKRREETKDLGV